MALKPELATRRDLRERLRAALHKEMPEVASFVRSRRHCEPGDELRLADSGGGRDSGSEPGGRSSARREGSCRACETAVPSRFAIRPDRRLSRHCRSTSTVTVQDNMDSLCRRGPLASSRDLVLAFHRPELLARSKLRQRLSDSGRDPAESDSIQRRCSADSRWRQTGAQAAARRSSGDKGRHQPWSDGAIQRQSTEPTESHGMTLGKAAPKSSRPSVEPALRRAA